MELELAGPAEVQRILGVSRQRVVQLAAENDFPEPLAKLEMGSVWDASSIRAWARAKGRAVYA